MNDERKGPPVARRRPQENQSTDVDDSSNTSNQPAVQRVDDLTARSVAVFSARSGVYSARLHQPPARRVDGIEAAARVADLVSDLPFQRRIGRVCGHGHRVVAELIAAVAVDADAVDGMLVTLARFADLPPEAVEFGGGDRFPPRAPLHAIRFRRRR